MDDRKAAATPTDSEAGYGARTGRAPRNLEETRTRAQKAVQDAGTEDEKGYCQFCAPLPPLIDRRGMHNCARCRKELLPAFGDKRTKERAAERDRRQRLEASRP